MFLWEGVTLYLSEDDVRNPPRSIRRNAAAGGAIAANFYGDRMIRIGASKLPGKALEYTQEALGFGLPFATNCEETLQRSLILEGIELGASYFMGRSSAKGPFAIVAELPLQPPATRRS